MLIPLTLLVIILNVFTMVWSVDCNYYLNHHGAMHSFFWMLSPFPVTSLLPQMSRHWISLYLQLDVRQEPVPAKSTHTYSVTTLLGKDGVCKFSVFLFVFLMFASFLVAWGSRIWSCHSSFSSSPWLPPAAGSGASQPLTRHLTSATATAGPLQTLVCKLLPLHTGLVPNTPSFSHCHHLHVFKP